MPVAITSHHTDTPADERSICFNGLQINPDHHYASVWKSSNSTPCRRYTIYSTPSTGGTSDLIAPEFYSGVDQRKQCVSAVGTGDSRVVN